MSVLAALTPPFLVCAVVIAAIVVFLRHEMGRGRTRRGFSPEDDSDAAPQPVTEQHDGAGSDAGPTASACRDG
jgi:hypothetical protein